MPKLLDQYSLFQGQLLQYWIQQCIRHETSFKVILETSELTKRFVTTTSHLLVVLNLKALEELVSADLVG